MADSIVRFLDMGVRFAAGLNTVREVHAEGGICVLVVKHCWLGVIVAN